MENTQGKRIHAKVKTVLIAAAASIALIAVFVCVFQLINNSKTENSSIAVYKKGNTSVIRIDDMEISVPDSSASGFKCDAKSERVFFTVDSAYSDGLYDLYYVEKRRSELLDPKIIDIGVRENYDIVSGKIYYLKKNIAADAFEGCVCDIDNNKIETFSDNVEGIYALEGTEKVFFTKMHGNIKVLYEYENKSPAEVCRDISDIYCYNDTENPHIIFEKKSDVNLGMSELYIAYADRELEMICDNTYHVMYDDYVPNGNLYYFTSSTESISWSYVIADQYAETDKDIVKPKRDDFFSWLGISEEYNQAFKEYQDKLVRDEIRAALNESVVNGEFSVPVFNAFAYNGDGIFKIAENLDPKNVYAVSAFGAPKIIFERTEVLSADTDMNTLVEIAQRSTMTEVIDYAKTIVDESVKSNGMAFVACGDDGAVSSALDGYDKRKTLFSFSRDGSRIFAFVRDSQGERLNLYTNSINENLKPSAEIGVDSGISSYRFVDDSVIYLKSDLNKVSGDVFTFDGKNSVKLSNAASAFTVENYEDVIILKEHDFASSKQTADYYICTDGEEKLIGSDIIVESFQYTDDRKAAYITSDNMLWIYNGEKSVSVADGTSEIMLLA